MKFIKLDTKMLDSSLWVDREAREVFVTALLMANPIVTDAPREELATRELRHTGLMVPPGRYGIVSAAGVGIVRRAGLDIESGMKALERLAMPDPESRTRDLDGRRLVRVDGGFIVVTFAKHYDPDETATERQRRWREKRRAERDVTPSTAVTSRLDRDVEGDREVEGEEIGTDSLESARTAARKPAGTPIPDLAVECAGKGPASFVVTREQVVEWEGAFPGVDVPQELRKAFAWLNANPTRRKTAKGMPRFCVTWLGRTQDRGGAGALGGPKPQQASRQYPGHCDWHQETRNLRKPSFRPLETCPECRHVKRMASRRESEPENVGDLPLWAGGEG